MEDEHLRRVTRGHGKRGGAALKCRDPLLEHGLGRIRDARIDIAEGLEVEQRRGMINVLEDIGGGLIDRRDPGAGGGVWMGAGVDR